MSKTLIIAEKPSVARDIATALGLGKAMEDDNLVISHCVGHLVELFVPEADNNYELPIIPKQFSLAVKEPVKAQYATLEKLLARSDISHVVNACDAGREGELIFRLVYEKANCQKTMQRMWLQSMTQQAIQTAWQDRKNGQDYNALAAAARCRAESDWLFGINGSRAVKSSIGRVMTPTLALVVDRYEANKNFVPQSFYEIVGTFDATAGSYKGKWIDTTNDGEEQASRFQDKSKALAIINGLVNKHPSAVNETVTAKAKPAPLLFHLTSLQQEANRVFGYSASRTLELAQALYERHKVLTYPRTDADALPSDYVSTATNVLQQLTQSYESIVKPILDNSWITPNKRIFNDSKISDHFAIIPTGVISNTLTNDEQNIFELVAKRFIAIFYPDAQFENTVRLTKLDGHTFKSTGRVLKSQGWLSVYGGVDDEDDKEPSLVAVQPNESIKTNKLEVTTGKTKPPALFTEATLLKAMETAGKQIDDEELASAMKDKGLGTPATRAAMIEKLKHEGKHGAYMSLDKKALVPTERGLTLITYLKQASPQFVSPTLTGEWEHQLKQMEKGHIGREEFMKSINQSVHDFIDAIKQNPPASTQEALGDCPVCKTGKIYTSKYSYMCGNCSFKFSKEICAYVLSPKDVSGLIESGKTNSIDGFVSTKTQKKFTATLKVVPENSKVIFDFSGK